MFFVSLIQLAINMSCRKMVLQIFLYVVLQFKMVKKCVAYGCDAGANLRVNEVKTQ